VLAAGQRSAPDAPCLFATLCQVYWYPLYAYVRRQGHSPDDGKDVTQEFFARLLEKNVAKLRDEVANSSKLEHFEHLKPYLGGVDSTVPYRPIAAGLGKTEVAVKAAVHRLRQRCRALLLAEIAPTVSGPHEVDEELQDLFEAVSQ
jgi:hypothetical protein